MFSFFQSSENSLVKRSSQDNNGSRIGKLRTDGSGFGKGGNFREVKRQKQLNYELSSQSGALMTNSESELRIVSQPSAEATKTSDVQFSNRTNCAFCHSAEISEVTSLLRLKFLFR